MRVPGSKQTFIHSFTFKRGLAVCYSSHFYPRQEGVTDAISRKQQSEIVDLTFGGDNNQRNGCQFDAFSLSVDAM